MVEVFTRIDAKGRVRRLGDIVDRLTNGFVGPTRDIYVDQGVPYLLARHVRDGRLIFDGITFVTPSFNEKHKKSKLKSGDVLLVQSGHIGHSAVVGSDHDGHNCHAMIVMSPVKGVLVGEYLCYFFTSPEMRRLFEGIRSGSTVPHLTCGAVKELAIPLPLVGEQQRIVALLDEAFEGIATAKVNAEKSLQNTRELLESRVESTFAVRGAGWIERPLETVANIVNGYAFKSTDFQSTPGAKSIKITNVGVREFVAGVGNFLPSAFADKFATVAVSKGSIVVALTRTIIAGGLKVAIVPDQFDGALINQRVAAIQPRSDELVTSFLLEYLSTRRVSAHVSSRVNTLMQPNLSIADLRSLPVPVPTLSEQRACMDHLACFQSETQVLESMYRRKLAALDELKMSLLRQAFSGAL